MYKPYVVTFFGHRQLPADREIEQRLSEIILTLLREHAEVEFLLGRSGDFDLLAASIVRRVRAEYGSHSPMSLLLPYMTAEYRDNETEFHRYYDSVEILDAPPGLPRRACIPLRNRTMAERADAVVCCIRHTSGGAYQATAYAQQLGLKLLHV